MPPRLNPLLTALVLLALGWGQVFGMARGYLCDCGGHVRITQMDHCHGPHSGHCHDAGEEDDGHSLEDHRAGEEHGDEGSTHEHPVLRESLTASQPQGLHPDLPQWVACEPAHVFWADLPPRPPPGAAAAPGRLLPRPAAPRPWPWLLARAVVLRI